jgi:hypothetical protein
MPAPKLTPEQNALAKQIGYFVDAAEEDKWFLLNGEDVWLGPSAATELEVKLWRALDVQRAEVEQVRVAIDEMNNLRVKFHTEHMLDKADADRFDKLLEIVVMILEGEELPNEATVQSRS